MNANDNETLLHTSSDWNKPENSTDSKVFSGMLCIADRTDCNFVELLKNTAGILYLTKEKSTTMFVSLKAWKPRKILFCPLKVNKKNNLALSKTSYKIWTVFHSTFLPFYLNELVYIFRIAIDQFTLLNDYFLYEHRLAVFTLILGKLSIW